MLEKTFTVVVLSGCATLLVMSIIRMLDCIIERIRGINTTRMELELRRCELFIRLKELNLPDNEIPQSIVNTLNREEQKKEEE